MSQSVDTLTADALQDTSRWFLRPATLKAATAVLVDHHHGLPLSSLWGNGPVLCSCCHLRRVRDGDSPGYSPGH